MAKTPPNEICLEGSVGASWWGEASFTPSDVRAMLKDKTGPLCVRLNSGGGVATDGQAIYSQLASYPGEVTIIVEGIAASAASLIAMAGDKIVMTAGALLMIHDPAQMFMDGRGTEADHRHMADVLSLIATSYAGIYARAAGITTEEARAIMQAETYYDAEGAIAAGFATEVSIPSEQKAAATFDYRIYANAPSALRDGSEGLGAIPTRAAIMPMFAGVPRTTKKKEAIMADTKKAAKVSAGADETNDPTLEIEGEGDEGEADAESTAVVAKVTPTMRERTRVSRLTNMVLAANLDRSLADEHIKKGTSEMAFLDIILAKQVEADVAHVNTERPSAVARGTYKDAREKFIAGAGLALEKKAGLPGGERNEFSSMSLSELARASLQLNGFNTGFTDKMKMIGQAFTMDAGGMSTSDFANVLANVMGKAALVGWEESLETYPLWTRKGVLNDFKPTKRVGVGAFAALPLVPEGDDYTYGTVGDRGENITLATYGKMLRINRQAIINDDLTLFGDLPRRMGRAAKRTVGNLAYAVLTANPVMSDALALFVAGHANNAATTGAPSVAALAAAKAAMLVQSDNGSALNIKPKYLIVPAALEMAAKQIINSQVDPTATKGFALNPVNGMAEIIVDARLDAASVTAWYLCADPNAFDTVEVAFLDGNDAPYLEQQNQWSADGVEMKVRIDAAAIPLDYRTLYRNTG